MKESMNEMQVVILHAIIQKQRKREQSRTALCYNHSFNDLFVLSIK